MRAKNFYFSLRGKAWNVVNRIDLQVGCFSRKKMRRRCEKVEERDNGRWLISETWKFRRVFKRWSDELDLDARILGPIRNSGRQKKVQNVWKHGRYVELSSLDRSGMFFPSYFFLPSLFLCFYVSVETSEEISVTPPGARAAQWNVQRATWQQRGVRKKFASTMKRNPGIYAHIQYIYAYKYILINKYIQTRRSIDKKIYKDIRMTFYLETCDYNYSTIDLASKVSFANEWDRLFRLELRIFTPGHNVRSLRTRFDDR